MICTSLHTKNCLIRENLRLQSIYLRTVKNVQVLFGDLLFSHVMRTITCKSEVEQTRHNLAISSDLNSWHSFSFVSSALLKDCCSKKAYQNDNDLILASSKEEKSSAWFFNNSWWLILFRCRGQYNVNGSLGRCWFRQNKWLIVNLWPDCDMKLQLSQERPAIRKKRWKICQNKP